MLKKMKKIPKEEEEEKIPKEEGEMQKFALLIGSNYTGQGQGQGQMSPLNGCINDVWRWKQCLIDGLGFSEQNISVLIDTDPSFILPTGDNIRSAIFSLINSAKPGDVLFVHFSGHGERQPAKADDDTGFVESIIAADGKRITDDDFRAFVDMVPKGCRITIVADCCHSGGLIEGAKEQIGDSTRRGRQTSRSGSQLEVDNFPPGLYNYVNYRAFLLRDEEQHDEITEMVHKLKQVPSQNSHPDCGILLSACQSYQRAAEVGPQNPDGAYGAFTNAILTIIEETTGKVSNRELVKKARQKLRLDGFAQRPGLYSSNRHASATFLC